MIQVHNQPSSVRVNYLPMGNKGLDRQLFLRSVTQKTAQDVRNGYVYRNVRNCSSIGQVNCLPDIRCRRNTRIRLLWQVRGSDMTKTETGSVTWWKYHSDGSETAKKSCKSATPPPPLDYGFEDQRQSPKVKCIENIEIPVETQMWVRVQTSRNGLVIIQPEPRLHERN